MIVLDAVIRHTSSVPPTQLLASTQPFAPVLARLLLYGLILLS